MDQSLYVTKGKFSARRIPSLFAVLLANTIASGLTWHHEEFDRGQIFETMRDLAPYWVWGTAFFLCGSAVGWAIITRSAWASIMSVLASTALWTLHVVSILMTVWTSPADLSPLGFAVYSFLLSGHLALMASITYVPHVHPIDPNKLLDELDRKR